jgi:hypothetical protein
MAPRKLCSERRTLFTTRLPVLAFWMLIAQRPSAACTIVLCATRLFRDPWAPSIR